MTINDLPTLNAALNITSAALLAVGFWQIKRKRVDLHKRFMLSAFAVSVAFLTSYIIYHSHVGSKPYPFHDWTRPVYYAILTPHVILAAAMTPFIIAALMLALRKKFETHKKWAKRTLPVWMFVSLTGVVVYLMLYR